MRLVFLFTLAGIALFAAIISVVADMSWLRFAVLLALIAVLSISFWIGGIDLLDRVGPWITSGYHVPEILTSITVFFLLLPIVKHQRLQQQSQSLNWGLGLGQNQFEARCVAYLKTHGWTITQQRSIGGMLIARAEKSAVRFAFLFVGSQANLENLFNTVCRANFRFIGKLVFVCYRDSWVPKDLVAKCEWGAVHYPALADFEKHQLDVSQNKSQQAI